MGTNLTSTVGNGNIQFSTAVGSSILLRPQGNTALTVSTTAVTIPSNRGFVAGNVSTLSGLVTASSGITLGKGITFPDGTHQTSAASGSTITAGAGMTLAGSTLGIDPTAVVHVAGISSDGGATFGGDINLLDNQLERPKFKDYAETVNAIGTITGNTAISFANGNVQTVTGNGNCEFSFTNEPASGSAGTITLLITNGGANTTTWEAAVKWPGNVAPALTASGVDIISFITVDGGTTIYGFVGGINFS
jgi:hypothetical protein